RPVRRACDRPALRHPSPRAVSCIHGRVWLVVRSLPGVDVRDTVRPALASGRGDGSGRTRITADSGPGARFVLARLHGADRLMAASTARRLPGALGGRVGVAVIE